MHNPTNQYHLPFTLTPGVCWQCEPQNFRWWKLVLPMQFQIPLIPYLFEPRTSIFQFLSCLRYYDEGFLDHHCPFENWFFVASILRLRNTAGTSSNAYKVLDQLSKCSVWHLNHQASRQQTLSELPQLFLPALLRFWLFSIDRFVVF